MPAMFADLVVATVNGTPVRLRDLGEVGDATKEVRTLARLNGQPAVVLQVQRQSGENTVEVIEARQGAAGRAAANCCRATSQSTSSRTSRVTSTRPCTRFRST